MIVIDWWLKIVLLHCTHIEIVGKISKSIFVFSPASVEICSPINTALEYLKFKSYPALLCLCLDKVVLRY